MARIYFFNQLHPLGINAKKKIALQGAKAIIFYNDIL